MGAGSGTRRFRETDPAPGLMTVHAEPLYWAVRSAFWEHPEVRVFTRDEPRGCTGVYVERAWQTLRRPIGGSSPIQYVTVDDADLPPVYSGGPLIEELPAKIVGGKQVFSHYELGMISEWQLEVVGDWLLREMRGLAKAHGRDL